MPVRLAILGLDMVQRPWLDALKALGAAGEVQLVAVGHHAGALCRDVAGYFKQPIPVFDDLRLLLKETAPAAILMDRPPNAPLEFLRTCVSQGIAIFSLGPPVESLAEAQALADMLEPRTHLLHIWPRFVDSPAWRHCAQADEFLRPIRFASASWLGVNHALAKAHPHDAGDLPVRSLTVLAWDVLGTLVPLMGLPTSVYAALRGTISSGSSFADISGAASVTLRFPDDAAASLTLCDRAPVSSSSGTGSGPWSRRDLLLWGGGGKEGGGGTLRLAADTYEFRDDAGCLIDAGSAADAGKGPGSSGMSVGASDADPLAAFREFLRHQAMPSSPHRGWTHHLVEIAATLEALVVSHRTGQPESPDRLRLLRR
jgi:predicted dehydrogenase